MQIWRKQEWSTQRQLQQGEVHTKANIVMDMQLMNASTLTMGLKSL